MRTLLTFLSVILIISCGGNSKKSFVGAWHVQGYVPVLISESNDEIIVATRSSDLGKGEFRATFEGNTLSYTVNTGFGHAKIDIKYDEKMDQITINTIKNELVKLDRYAAVKNPGDMVGVWIYSDSEYGVKDTLTITKKENSYEFDLRGHARSDMRGKKVAKPTHQQFEVFIKNGICFKDKESISNIITVKVLNDTLNFYGRKMIASK